MRILCLDDLRSAHDPSQRGAEIDGGTNTFPAAFSMVGIEVELIVNYK